MEKNLPTLKSKQAAFKKFQPENSHPSPYFEKTPLFRLMLQVQKQTGFAQTYLAMKTACKRKLKFRLVFITLFFLCVSNLQAQPADSRPIIKYVINNYTSLAKAECDTCTPIVGKPLRVGKPIPFPPTAAINAIPGVDINEIPGLAAPNFLGGGSPEIKGLVKSVAGMTETYAKRFRTDDKLYFRTGAAGVAISKSGKIITSSGTILPGERFDDVNLVRGFFPSFQSPQGYHRSIPLLSKCLSKAQKNLL